MSINKPKLDENTIYLIDGSGYIFRAFFAIRSLRSKKGVPTNAVYGFSTMLLKLLREHNPKYVAIAFDQKAPTFRHKIYEGYKANRPLPPEDLIPQFALINEVVDAFKIKRLSMPGFEADDIIGTLAKQASSLGKEVVIVSGDKDLMQLVDDNVWMLDELRAAKVGTEQFFGPEDVKREMGVEPKQVVDILALAGDSSDNVPGVSGIGKKTAQALIEQFGSLEKLLELSILIKKPAQREKIINGQASALLSKRLVSIDQEVPIECGLADLEFKGIDVEKTAKLFLELDFTRLLKDEKLFANKNQSAPNITNNTETKYQSIHNKESLLELMSLIKNHQKIAIDSKTDDADDMKSQLLEVSLAFDNHAFNIPITPESKEYLASLFQDKQKIWIANNAKSHEKIFIRNGLPSFVVGGDPMLASYLLNQSSSLLKQTKLEPDLSLELEGKLLKDIAKDGLSNLYYELELPLEVVLAKMELYGVKIDKTILSELGEELKGRLHELEKSAHDIAGQDFNLASPKQVAEILFDKLGLKPGKKTKTGASTDSSVLEMLKDAHALPRILLEHRMCAKLINTYIETLPTLINEQTGRIHTTYNQFVTATGRLSSKDPNLQNIPIRTKEGRKIRRAFVAKDNKVLISLDYSQVELRLLALVSKDPVLLDSFAKDQDVHLRTASEIFECEPEKVSKAQRNAAKTINFGLLYGMGAFKLAQTLGISSAEAKSYLAKYFAKYAGILTWKEEVLQAARVSTETRTLFGRKRLIPEILSKSGLEQSRGERLAINTPIQGTAADIIKKAMIDTDKFLTNNHPNAHLIMQVHDELVIEAPKADAQSIAYEVSKIMSHGHGLKVDLKVEFGIAENWDDAH